MGQRKPETLKQITARIEVTHFLPRQERGPVERLEEPYLEGSVSAHFH